MTGSIVNSGSEITKYVWSENPEVKFNWRRGTSDQWTEKNPVLRAGEPGYDRTTGWFKVGDGITPWIDLPYFIDEIQIASLIDDAILNLPGGGGPGEDRYLYTRTVPASTWVIEHNLGFIKDPVILLSTAPTVRVLTDIIHGSVNVTTIIFPSPVAGKAYF